MTEIDEIKNKILPILKSAGVRRAALFGSRVRGDNRSDSDVDILVEMPIGASLFDVGGLKADLEESLDKDVDIVQFDSIKPRIKDLIMSQKVTIL